MRLIGRGELMLDKGFKWFEIQKECEKTIMVIGRGEVTKDENVFIL